MSRAVTMRWRFIAANVALALASLDARAQQTIPATALPTGGRLVAGQATISQSGTAMSIVQGTSRAVLDWQSFNIGANASVVFSQPSASAVALNRVLGGSPSQIFGRLSSNGQVFLTNPSGILFGRGAQVDVGGILATTLAMSTDDFMSGHYLLHGDGTNSSILNEGTLRSAPKGYVALIAPVVQNTGVIDAASGTAALVAANAATVDFMADGLIQIKVEQGAINAEITNKGAIRADGGTVFLTASALDSLARSVVNNSGLIEARNVENVKGVIRLSGGEVNLLPTSSISAAGGGQIEVQGGTVLADGIIDASNISGTGGTIKLLGDRVGLIGNARVDASGDTGGGTVLVGGDFQGKNPDVQNAFRTYFGRDAAINADAITSGDGGKVIVWADDVTRYFGTISARGGAQSGNGGFAEVSGHNSLIFSGKADLSSAHGTAGTLLLDPNNINIVNGGAATLATATGNATTPETYTFAENAAGDSAIDASAITALTNAGTNVTLQAHTDITVSEAIVSTGAGALVLRAGDDVFVNSLITIGAGGVSITAGDAGGTPSGLNSDAGRNIAVNAAITTLATTTSGTPSGSISLTATDAIAIGANLATGTATFANAAGTTTARSGNITLSAPGGSVTGSGLLTTGNASLTGTSGGVRNSTDTATSGSISITAGGGGVDLSGANALTVGTSNVAATLGTATSGNVSIASGGAVDSIGSPLQVRIGSATTGTGATAVAGKLSASTSAGGAGIFAASPSASLVLSTINAAGITTITSGSGSFTTGDLTTTGAITAGGTVVLQAARDVTIGTSATNTPVSVGTTGAGFVAQAGRHVTVNAPLTTINGAIVLEADSPTAVTGAADKIGQLTINAAVKSNGGGITLIGGGNSIQGPDGNVNNIGDNGGIRLGAVVDAGGPPGGINVALSGPSTIGAPLGIGTIGIITQILGNPISNLHTTGALVIGTATTAGTDGRGTNAVATTTSAISDVITGAVIGLTSASGSSVALVAGAGGITASNALTSQQPLTVQTTGNFRLSAPLNTNNNQLTLNVTGSINTSGGSITTGTAPATVCTASSGCPSGSIGGPFIDQWNGSIGTDWTNGSNWSLGHAPGPTEVALIPVNGTPYVVNLGSAGLPVNNASVGLLVNSGNLTLTGNSVTKTRLDISNSFFDCSLVICSGVATGTTNTSLNFGTLSLNNAILGGTGSLNNQGTVNLANSTISASVSQTAGVLNATSGANVLSGSSLGFAGGTSLNVLANTTTVSSATGNYAGTINIGTGGGANAELDFTAGAHNIVGGTLQTLTAGSVVGIAGANVEIGSGATYSVATTNLSAGSLAFDSSIGTPTPLTLPILNLSGGGSLQIAGNVVITDMTQTGGSVLPGSTPSSSGGSGSIKVSNFHTSGSGGTFNGTGGTFGTGDCVTHDCFSDIDVTFGAGLSLASPLAASNSMKLNAGSGALALGASVSVRDLVGDPTGVLGKGTLTLIAGTSITQSAGAIDAGNVTGSAGTAASLNSSLNTISDLGTFTTGSGALSVKNSMDLHVNGALSGGTSVTLEAIGNQSDVMLDVGGTVTSHAGDIVLAAGNTFINNASAGASALSASGGRWLVYSNDFLRDVGGNIVDTRGGLAYDFKQYNASYEVTSVAQPTGNGFLYTVAPVIVPSLSGSASKVYSGSVTAPTASLQVTAGATDAIDGDALSLGASAAAYDNRNVGTGKAVTVLSTDINIAATSSTGKPVYGYQLSPSVPASLQVASGVITTAPLTVTAQTDNRGYNGTTSSSVAPVVTGTVYDAVGTAATQTYDNKNVGATHVLSASGLVLADGNSGNNYAISYVPSAATGVITAAPLTVTAQTDNRGYNGTTGSSVAPVVSGTMYDTVGTAATQTYDNKNVGATHVLSASGLVLADGNSGNNYAISYVPSLSLIHI